MLPESNQNQRDRVKYLMGKIEQDPSAPPRPNDTQRELLALMYPRCKPDDDREFTNDQWPCTLHVCKRPPEAGFSTYANKDKLTRHLRAKSHEKDGFDRSKLLQYLEFYTDVLSRPGTDPVKVPVVDAHNPLVISQLEFVNQYGSVKIVDCLRASAYLRFDDTFQGPFHIIPSFGIVGLGLLSNSAPGSSTVPCPLLDFDGCSYRANREVTTTTVALMKVHCKKIHKVPVEVMNQYFKQFHEHKWLPERFANSEELVAPRNQAYVRLVEHNEPPKGNESVQLPVEPSVVQPSAAAQRDSGRSPSETGARRWVAFSNAALKKTDAGDYYVYECPVLGDPSHCRYRQTENLDQSDMVDHCAADHGLEPGIVRSHLRKYARPGLIPKIPYYDRRFASKDRPREDRKRAGRYPEPLPFIDGTSNAMIVPEYMDGRHLVVLPERRSRSGSRSRSRSASRPGRDGSQGHPEVDVMNRDVLTMAGLQVTDHEARPSRTGRSADGNQKRTRRDHSASSSGSSRRAKSNRAPSLPKSPSKHRGPPLMPSPGDRGVPPLPSESQHRQHLPAIESVPQSAGLHHSQQRALLLPQPQGPHSVQMQQQYGSASQPQSTHQQSTIRPAGDTRSNHGPKHKKPKK